MEDKWRWNDDVDDDEMKNTEWTDEWMKAGQRGNKCKTLSTRQRQMKTQIKTHREKCDSVMNTHANTHTKNS